MCGYGGSKKRERQGESLFFSPCEPFLLYTGVQVIVAKGLCAFCCIELEESPSWIFETKPDKKNKLGKILPIFLWHLTRDRKPSILTEP